MANRHPGTILHYLRHLTRPRDLDGLTDRQLLECYAHQGDEAAFTTLVRRHFPLVLGVCRRVLRHTQDAEEATQAAFLVLARKSGTVPWHDSVAGWLHEVAVRVASEARSSIARRRSHEQQVETLPESVASPDPSWREVSALLDDELRRLPDKYRAPLLRCYLEGRTRDEAAELLGWTLGMVKGRLERGRELLRKRLIRRGLTLSAALSSLYLAAGAVEAAVPAAMLQRTLELALGFATSSASPALAAIPAVTLAEGVLNSMLATKIKGLATVLVLLLLVTGSAGALAWWGWTRTGTPDSAAQFTSSTRDTNLAAPRAEEKDFPIERAVPRSVLTFQHAGTIRQIAITPDGKPLVSASFDGTFRLWDLANEKVVREWKIDGLNSAVAVSRDGKLLAGGNAEGELFVWDRTTGEEQLARKTRQGNIYQLTFSPNDRTLASANHQGTVSLWDAATGKNLRHLTGHTRRVWTMAFSPDGKLLASGGEDGTVRLWDPATGKELRQLQGHQNHISWVTFSPDGKLLAVSDTSKSFRGGDPLPDGKDDTIRLWEVKTGREVLRIATPLTHGLSFSPDGKALVSGDRQQFLYLWDTTTGKQLHRWKAHDQAIHCVIFAPDGRRLASSCDDGTIRLWKLEIPR